MKKLFPLALLLTFFLAATASPVHASGPKSPADREPMVVTVRRTGSS